MKIAVYGIGKIAEEFYNYAKDKEIIEIVYFVQSKKQKDTFFGKM